MAVIGYIAYTELIDKRILAKTKTVMQELKCDMVYTEITSESTERPKLKYIMEEVKEGDTIVFHKLSNALANMVELTNLCRLCQNENIRIVSIRDNIDSRGTYYKTSHKELFGLLSSFCQEAYASKHKMKKLKDISDTVKKIEKQRLQEEKEVKVVNMYQSDYSYQEIKDELHIKSNRTIMNILAKHDVSPSRQKCPKKNETEQ